MLGLLASSPLLTIMLVVALGAAVGMIPFGPLKLGAAGALFVGLAVGALDPALGDGLGLISTLGLALFVYTVGIAAGETFFSDLRRQLPLMILAVAAIAAVTALASLIGSWLGLDTGMVAGLIAGALTSTPALAAATAATGSPDAGMGRGGAGRGTDGARSKRPGSRLGRRHRRRVRARQEAHLPAGSARLGGREHQDELPRPRRPHPGPGSR